MDSNINTQFKRQFTVVSNKSWEYLNYNSIDEDIHELLKKFSALMAPVSIVS